MRGRGKKGELHGQYSIGLRKNYFDTRNTTRGMDVLISLSSRLIDGRNIINWLEVAQRNVPSEHVMFGNIPVNESAS